SLVRAQTGECAGCMEWPLQHLWLYVDDRKRAGTRVPGGNKQGIGGKAGGGLRLLNAAELLCAADETLDVVKMHKHSSADPSVTNKFRMRPAPNRINTGSATDGGM